MLMPNTKESIVIICPDTNIRLWNSRTAEVATGGGKSAIMELATAWARNGHVVTIAGGNVEESLHDRLAVRTFENSKGNYDVAIYVTGSVGHFNEPAISKIQGSIRLFWINGPTKVSLPPGPLPRWFVAPARFLARKAIDSWGYPADRVVVIPGWSVTSSYNEVESIERHPLGIVYASHPFKGLDNAVAVIESVRRDYNEVFLDVFGSAKLWGDRKDTSLKKVYPEWVRFKKTIPQREVRKQMKNYGVFLYLTSWIDGFSLATTEALSAGLIVIATDHGANGELICHGWNGYLVAVDHSSEPNLQEAEYLLRKYLESPLSFNDMRKRAARSVPSWEMQAYQWQRIWQSS